MAKLDVLLVTPPSRLEVYQNLGGELAAIEPPVWAGLIAEYMLRAGYQVDMLDAEAEGLTHEQTARRIVEADPLLAVFVVYGQQPSASTQCMPGACKTARLLEGETKGAIATLALGTHPSALPARTLREEVFTFVGKGEGPATVRGLVEALKGKCGLDEVPGLWRRQDGVAVGNPPAPVIDQLELDGVLPRQAWQLLDMSRYRAHNWHCFDDLASRGSYASVQTSLGCPFKCAFCCINTPFGTNALRLWSADAILAQIDELVEVHHVKNIKIPDEMFVLNRRHVLALCEGLIARDYGLNIWAYARVDTVADEDMLVQLKRAGFNWLALGIEAASSAVRGGVTKGRFADVDIPKAVGRVREAGIHVCANYIFGLPDDDHASMRATLDLALDLNTEWANFYSAMAYPGSALHAQAEEMGWPRPEDPGGPGWIGYSQHSFDCLPLPTKHLSAIEVLDFRDQAFDAYFTAPAYLAMIENTFSAEARRHIEAMAGHRLKRRHHPS